MKKRALLALVMAVSVTAALGSPASFAAGKGKKKSGPLVIGTDEAGDWGANVDRSIAPLGNALGQDLVEASIGLADKETLNFVIAVGSLPPIGGVPEISRYTWDFAVDGTGFQLSGAFTEYIRGVCNPLTTGTCPPPRDPGAAPFFLRTGDCTVGGVCEEAALLHATFDPATSTITIPVPLEVLKAKPGSKVTPGATLFGGTIYSAPGVLVTTTAFPHDILIANKTFTVPKK